MTVEGRPDDDSEALEALQAAEGSAEGSAEGRPREATTAAVGEAADMAFNELPTVGVDLDTVGLLGEELTDVYDVDEEEEEDYV
jgi:hypothetical protein